jgi:hypothetical protein
MRTFTNKLKSKQDRIRFKQSKARHHNIEHDFTKKYETDPYFSGIKIKFP